MKTTLYFVRHAEANSGAWHDQNRTLTEAGAHGAQAVLDTLEEIEIDVFISSSSPRTIDTIKPLADAHQKPIEVFDELQELVLRGPEYHLDDADVATEVQKVFEIPDYKLPGGTSKKSFEETSVAFFRTLIRQYEGKTVVVGTHGIILTLILASYDSSYGYDFWHTTTKPDIYRVELDGEVMKSCQRIWSE